MRIGTVHLVQRRQNQSSDGEHQRQQDDCDPFHKKSTPSKRLTNLRMLHRQP